jgi:hypothetical protein
VQKKGLRAAVLTVVERGIFPVGRLSRLLYARLFRRRDVGFFASAFIGGKGVGKRPLTALPNASLNAIGVTKRGLDDRY